MEKPIPTIFFGTHNFAAAILQGLTNSPLVSIEVVVTQPDKAVGRKRELQPSPVKILAQSLGLVVEQPDNLKEFQIEKDQYDLGISAQYGNIIPKSVIDRFKHGILNIHTSLLPKYRGASPIQSAIINGETETGVTIMLIDEGMDTGPILLQKRVEIGQNDTYPILDEKLAKIGSQALLEAIPDHISGEIKPISQDNTTECSPLSRADGEIDWGKTSQEIYNQYRGMTPWPGVWTTWNGKRLKILEIQKSEIDSETGKVMVENDKIHIGTKEGSIEVLKLQLEGKKEMDSKSFLVGHSNFDKQDLCKNS